TRSAEFNQPLIPVRTQHDPSTGGLPQWGSLIEVQPERAVRIGALKAAGNPTARGSAHRTDPAEGIVVRLVEALGRTTEVSVQSGLRDLSAQAHVNLVEEQVKEPIGFLNG